MVAEGELYAMGGERRSNVSIEKLDKDQLDVWHIVTETAEMLNYCGFLVLGSKIYVLRGIGSGLDSTWVTR